MSTVEDFEDTEVRDQFGMPPLAKIVAAERAAVTSKIDQKVDNSVNKSLPWIFVTGVLATIALGGWIASLDRISDINERAARAEERADLLQYYVMELDGKLMQWNIIKPQESFAGQARAREESKQQQSKPENKP